MSGEHIDINEVKSKELFKCAQLDSVVAPPFLKTRILAELAENERREKRIRFWQFASLASSVLLLSIIVWSFSLHRDQVFEAVSYQPIAVRIEITKLTEEQVAEIEINLPDGVTFFSAKLPELANERSLKFAVQDVSNPEQLSIVVKSSVQGVKKLKIKYYNNSRQVIFEKSLQIKFKGEGVS